MKVLYTIFTTSHGNGGHFYSLATTAKALSSKAEVVIVNFGFASSPVIQNSGIKHYNILLRGSSLIEPYSKFRDILKKENPDILHSFCTISFLFVRIYSIFNPIRKIVTKCGGPNPKRYFPYVEELILYSKENYKYFENSRKFLSSSLYLIPQRVLEQKSDSIRLHELNKVIAIENKPIVFLRIGRISAHYKKSTLQAINLVDDINSKGYSAILLLLGSVQNQEVFDELLSINSNNVIHINDPKYTTDASELIDIADFVIGTGRSLMEAASKSKILLTPNRGTHYPVLVAESNIENLLETNFSPRNNLLINDEDTLNNILNLIKDESKAKELASISFKLFEDYFNIAPKVDFYIKLYSGLKNKRNPIRIEFFIHLCFIKVYVKKYKV